jgi:hypothetical protein
MSIMALLSRSDPVCWELMPLQGTGHWRSYVRNACQIGLPVILFVQVYQKEGSSSQLHEEAKDGDEGESVKRVEARVVQEEKRRWKKLLREMTHLLYQQV